MLQNYASVHYDTQMCISFNSTNPVHVQVLCVSGHLWLIGSSKGQITSCCNQCVLNMQLRWKYCFYLCSKDHTHVLIDIVKEHKQSALHSLSFRHALHLHGIYDVSWWAKVHMQLQLFCMNWKDGFCSRHLLSVFHFSYESSQKSHVLAWNSNHRLTMGRIH